MFPQYYSQRQLSPYRGMLHVVDVGYALAYTADGEQWFDSRISVSFAANALDQLASW